MKAISLPENLTALFFNTQTQKEPSIKKFKQYLTISILFIGA
jgi:hypothetical protein